jgi:hypothetical protein
METAKIRGALQHKQHCTIHTSSVVAEKKKNANYSLRCAKVGLVPSLTEVGGQSGGGLTKNMKGALIAA